MDDKLEPAYTKGLEQSLHLVKVPKRDRHYKKKYLQARNVAICLFCLLTLMALIVGWTLKGNAALQQRIQDKDITIVLPNGKSLTGR